jgi:hypothetical protein
VSDRLIASVPFASRSAGSPVARDSSAVFAFVFLYPSVSSDPPFSRRFSFVLPNVLAIHCSIDVLSFSPSLCFFLFLSSVSLPFLSRLSLAKSCAFSFGSSCFHRPVTFVLSCCVPDVLEKKNKRKKNNQRVSHFFTFLQVQAAHAHDRKAQELKSMVGCNLRC